MKKTIGDSDFERSIICHIYLCSPHENSIIYDLVKSQTRNDKSNERS